MSAIFHVQKFGVRMKFYNNSSEIGSNFNHSKPTEVSKSEPCIHCGKPDWCYRIGALTVCKRGAEPAIGWEKTSKSDKESTPYYAPIQPKKSVRPAKKQEFFYPDRQGIPLVKVLRIDKGNGEKDFPQFRWDAGSRSWIAGLTEEVKKQVPIYKYKQVKEAITAGKTIFIVEGEACADLLWKIGLCATTTLGGSGKFHSYGDYQQDLSGAKLVLCPDRDEPGLKYMEAIAQVFPHAKWLYAPPSKFFWQHLPKSNGLDIADWIADYHVTCEDILGAIGERRSYFNKPLEQPGELAQREEDENKPCTLARQFQEVKAVLGQRLRLNSLKLQIELDGQPLNPDRVHLQLANDFNLQIARANALDIVSELGEQRAYSPVVEYLNRVYDQYGGDTTILNDFASRYFGTDNSIYNTYLQKTLVAAVARVMQPGCKMDTALILQGKQGVGKSSFFKLLAGEDWFDDSLGHISDKDERLKLHVTWFIEWAELESVFKRRDLASVKAFLTCSRDYIRPPYGRSVQAFNRPSIIVGTTNQDEFLGDPTGNRRFWVIPLQKVVDLRQLQQERDRIWAAAVTLYKAGELWWLSQSEEEVSTALISEYQIVDPWQEEIAKFIAVRITVTTSEILHHCIHVELERQDRNHKMRVANILRSMGWVQERQYVNGKRKRVWVCVEKK